MSLVSPAPSQIVLTSPASAVRAPQVEAAPLDRKAAAYLWIFSLMLACWLSGEALALAGWIASPLDHALQGVRYASFYFVMMFACITLVHLGTRAPQCEWRAMAALGPAATLGVLILDRITLLGLTLADAACVGFGVASIGLLGVRVRRSRGEQRARAMCLFMLTCMLPVFTVLNPFFQDLTNLWTPITLDPYAYAADEALGAQWSFVAGRWFEAAPPLRIVAGVVYYTLLFAFLGVVVVQQRAQQPPYLEIFPTLLGTTLAGYALYILFPLVGPAPAFGPAYPHAPPDVAAVFAAPLDAPLAPRNCMPSLHTVWVLLIWWHSRPFAWPLRLGAGVYLTFTLLATLGFGFHYLVDLIVAVPFALLVQAQAMPRSPETSARRLGCMGLGAALVAGWLLAIRYGLPLLAWWPAASLAASALTVAVVWQQERRLFRAYCSSAAATIPP
jgi:PAP2 superfamily